MAAQLTNAETDTVFQRNHLAQVMVSAVARTGSGLFLQEVQDFQRFWNSSLPTTVRQAQAVGAPSSMITALKSQTLVTDGQYGPKTSAALGVIVGSPLPPTRASGMTVWYAQNKDRVDALAPMNTVPIDQAVSPTMPSIDPSSGVQQSTVSISSGSTVRTAVIDATAADPNTTATAMQQPMAQAPVVVQPDTSGIITPAAITTSKVTVVDFTSPTSPGTPIVATPRKGGVPIMALLFGGAALGGILWYFTRKGARGSGRRMRMRAA